MVKTHFFIVKTQLSLVNKNLFGGLGPLGSGTPKHQATPRPWTRCDRSPHRSAAAAPRGMENFKWGDIVLTNQLLYEYLY